MTDSSSEFSTPEFEDSFFHIKTVDSLAEALQIAEKGKRSGKWDMFRGQSNAEWFVQSTSERLSPEEEGPALEKVKRFFEWAGTTEGVPNPKENPDCIWAIAQHYGLKTQFIDFTYDPNVAAFFACDSSKPPHPGKHSSIICLNSIDFIKFWSGFLPTILEKNPTARSPEIISIDVANLWRLQQQQGLFLWNPVRDLERIYHFDRISFPSVTNVSDLPRREEIYPLNQSNLEKKISQFFMNEVLIEGHKAIASFDIPTYVIETPDNYHDANTWWEPGISSDPGWNDREAWIGDLVEPSQQALPGVALDLGTLIDFEGLHSFLINHLSEAFIGAHRDHALDLSQIDMGSLQPECHRILFCIRRLWNGMCTLPYSDSEVRITLVHSLELLKKNLMTNHLRKPADQIELYVEMASSMDGAGAYSRGTVNAQSMLAATNPTFLNAVREHTQCTDEQLAMTVVRTPGRPWERFTFNGLRSLLVEELIPSQLAWRVMTEGNEGLNTTIFYSPTDFKIFGLA